MNMSLDEYIKAKKVSDRPAPNRQAQDFAGPRNFSVYHSSTNLQKTKHFLE